MKEVMKIGKEEGMNIECLSIVLYWMILYILLQLKITKEL